MTTVTVSVLLYIYILFNNRHFFRSLSIVTTAGDHCDRVRIQLYHRSSVRRRCHPNQRLIESTVLTISRTKIIEQIKNEKKIKTTLQILYVVLIR